MSQPQTNSKQEMEKLRQRIDQQAQKIEKAERERPTVLAQTAYLGVLGLLFVLPVVGGAYLGHWLDSRLEGYSMSWTLNLLLLGVMVGAANVYFFIRERS